MTGGPRDTDFIKDELDRRLDEVVAVLWPNGYFDTHLKRWRSGDVFDIPPKQNGGSFMIDMQGDKRGLWYDHAAGEGGSILQALCQRNGGDWRAAFNEARQLLGIDPSNRAAYSGPTPEQVAAHDKRQRQQAADAAAEAKRKADYAKALWLQGDVLAPGDLAHRYFQGRGLDIRKLARPLNALRLAGEVKHPGTGEVLPCLLASVVNPPGGACHRTYLRQLPTGAVVKAYDRTADGADPKLSIGGIRGGHIPIQRGGSGRTLKNALPGERVIITEGIEDAVTLALALPQERVLCAVSAPNLGQVVLPDAIRTVILAADNDDVTDPEGKKIAKAVALHQATGRTVDVMRPPPGVKDVNDLIQQEMQRAG